MIITLLTNIADLKLFITTSLTYKSGITLLLG